MTTAEQIMVKLGLDNTSLKAGMASTTSYLREVGSHIGGIVTGYLGLEGAMELKHFAQEAGNFAHELLEQSHNLQVSVEWLQKYNSEAQRAGLDAESAAKSLRKFNERVGEARTGSKEATEKFQKWNITLDDANGRHKTTEQLIGDVVKRINEIPDASERAAAKLDLLGKQGEKTFEALANENIPRLIDRFHLTEKETEALSGFKPGGEFLGAIGKKLFAKAAQFTPFGAVGQLEEYHKKVREDSQELQEFNKAEEQRKTIAEALLKYAEREHAFIVKGLPPQERVNALIKDRERIYQQMQATDITNKDHEKLELQLHEKDLEINKAMLETERQRHDVQAKRISDFQKHYGLMEKLLHQVAPGLSLDKLKFDAAGNPVFIPEKKFGEIQQSDVDQLEADQKRMQQAQANFMRFQNDTTRGAFLAARGAVEVDKKRITDALDDRNNKDKNDPFKQAAHNAVQKFLREILTVRVADDE